MKAPTIAQCRAKVLKELKRKYKRAEKKYSSAAKAKDRQLKAYWFGRLDENLSNQMIVVLGVMKK